MISRDGLESYLKKIVREKMIRSEWNFKYGNVVMKARHKQILRDGVWKLAEFKSIAVMIKAWYDIVNVLKMKKTVKYL